MKRILAIATAACTLAIAALADTSGVLATYHADNCCLPPEYAWEANVTILESGAVTLQRCEGYATEGSGCTTRQARVSDAALAAIRAAVMESELAETPAAINPDPPMGGGGSSGSVILDGAEIALPRDPAVADQDRVKGVMRAIEAAFPASFRPLFND